MADDGYYSASNPNGWEVISFPAIRTNSENDYDPRPEGAALWPERHSLERLLDTKDKNSLTFDSLYQQDPQPNRDSLVYSDWIEIDSFPECDVEFYGMDFGFTNDPTALVRIGKNGQNIYLEEVLYQTGMLNSEIYARAVNANVNREIYADSADPRTIAELKKLGLNVIPAIKGPDSILAGINQVKEHRIHYTKGSINIKNERKNYSWLMRAGVNTNVPIDAHNHAMDALRYGIFTKYNRKKRNFAAV